MSLSHVVRHSAFAGLSLAAIVLTSAVEAAAQTPLCTLLGTSADERLGLSVAGLGDVNGDSVPDFVTGSSGKITIASGADCSVIRQLVSNPQTTTYSSMVAGLTDVSSDGVPDIVTLANDYPQPNAHLRIISGATGLEIARTTNFEGPIRNIVSAGDVNNDLIADFLVTTTVTYSPHRRGGVFLYSGSTGALLDSFLGNNFATGDDIGPMTAVVSDYDGDGKKDYLVQLGEILSSRIGPAFVVASSAGPMGISHKLICAYGPNPSYPVANNFQNVWCNATPGWHWSEVGMASIPDVDNDGYRDFAFGAAKGPVENGVVQIRSGKQEPFGLLRTLPSMSTGDGFGLPIIEVDDLDDDGIGDILVTAGDRTGTSPNYVRAFSPATGAPLFIAYSDALGDGFGGAAAKMDDVNGDGVGEILVASAGHTSGGISLRGRVQLFAGPSSGCQPTANLALQNETETGVKIYRVSGTISAGSQVTSPPYGPYIVSGSAASVMLIAGSSINLAPGFTVESGASFSAETQPGVCT